MTFADIRWALQLLAETTVGTRLREHQRAEDTAFHAARKAV